MLRLQWVCSVSHASFLTLGIETSCDDTSLAVLSGPREVLSSVVSSQVDLHAPYGGVLPELASRKHQEVIISLLRKVLSDGGVSNPCRDIDLVAVTRGPGLMGSLLVGAMTAKALAQAWEVPLIAVNHLEGHIFANVLAHPSLEPPFLCLIVSGGHTEIILVRSFGDYLLLGRTRDDAAGEAYDKVAKLLGLGYPGGPAIDHLAKEGDPKAFTFPVPLGHTRNVEFSFSGLKTAVLWVVRRLEQEGAPIPVADICASFQRAAVEALMSKVRLSVEMTGVERVAVSGGVAANSALREAMASQDAWDVYLPPHELCTDNAVMIAAAGYDAYARGLRSDISFSPGPSLVLAK